MSDLVTESDVRKLLTKEENKALDLAFEAEAGRGEQQSRGESWGSQAEWLINALHWRLTPQGLAYWSAIHYRLSCNSTKVRPPSLPDMMDADYCYGALVTGKATATEQQAAARHLRRLIAVEEFWAGSKSAEEIDRLRAQLNEQAGNPAQLVNEDGELKP